MMDDFEQRVLTEIRRLEGPDFPRGARAQRQRVETIKALAEASVAGEPWTGPNGALGPNRRPMVVNESNFYRKKHWHPHALTQEVLANVIGLYAERDAAERERARLAKRAWLENKEFEAAETQFAKAGDLLSLPHIMKKTKAGENTIILDPANAAVFNAAVNLNESGSKLARRSLGLPLDTAKSETTVTTAGPIQMSADLSGLDEKALDALINNLATAIGAGADREAAAEEPGDDA